MGHGHGRKRVDAAALRASGRTTPNLSWGNMYLPGWQVHYLGLDVPRGESVVLMFRPVQLRLLAANDHLQETTQQDSLVPRDEAQQRQEAPARHHRQVRPAIAAAGKSQAQPFSMKNPGGRSQPLARKSEFDPWRGGTTRLEFDLWRGRSLWRESLSLTRGATSVPIEK